MSSTSLWNSRFLNFSLTVSHLRVYLEFRSCLKRLRVYLKSFPSLDFTISIELLVHCLLYFINSKSASLQHSTFKIKRVVHCALAKPTINSNCFQLTILVICLVRTNDYCICKNLFIILKVHKIVNFAVSSSSTSLIIYFVLSLLMEVVRFASSSFVVI